jgi:hypothetical protein
LTIDPLQAENIAQWLTTHVNEYEKRFGLKQRCVLLLALTEVKIGEQDSAIIFANDSDLADFTYYVIFTW